MQGRNLLIILNKLNVSEDVVQSSVRPKSFRGSEFDYNMCQTTSVSSNKQARKLIMNQSTYIACPRNGTRVRASQSQTECDAGGDLASTLSPPHRLPETEQKHGFHSFHSINLNKPFMNDQDEDLCCSLISVKVTLYFSFSSLVVSFI